MSLLPNTSRSLPPSGTVTFLFTDIEGSTRLWEQHPDAMRSALARHDALIFQIVSQQGGYIFKTGGDAFCAAFATAPPALEAALAVQIALHAESWNLPTPLRVRIALHTGAGEERDGDYFGPPLNRAARLRAAAHGGQTLLSVVVQELVCETLPPDVSLRDLGRHRLKDLGRPEQVFQLRHPTLPDDFPPLQSLDNPASPNNLPSQISSLIGRETETADVAALTRQARLVTLTGTGGAGKSRLSLQVAADRLDQFLEGAWLVELAPLSDPALVPQAVAATLGIAEQADRSLLQTLTATLASQHLLLVLDNCEHLLGACAALAAALLRDCPQVSILASSREALNIPGEQVYRIPPLSLPPPSEVPTAASLPQYDAVRLFLDRAHAVQPSFTVTDANAPAVAQICFQLDGIPLAIELAAVRVRTLSVEQIHTRLNDRFKLLTGGSRTALPRQQTLRALLDWSYDLLMPAEQALLRHLSVFSGGWTLEAAEDICASGEYEESDVLDLVASLVDKSLVIYEDAADGGEGRYRLLETIRRYAQARRTEQGEADSVSDRAAAWFLALAEQADAPLQGHGRAAWLIRLDAEHDNLRASLTWLTAQEGADAAESSLRLAGALWRYWYRRGFYTEGRQWLARVLAHPAVSLAPAAARAQALSAAGNLASLQGDNVIARTLLEECLALERQRGDPESLARVLSSLGMIADKESDSAAARVLCEEALALRRQIGIPEDIVRSLNDLGYVALGEGDYPTARTLLEECLSLGRQIGHSESILRSLINLAGAISDQGDYPAARVLVEEGLTLARRLGHAFSLSFLLSIRASVAFGEGDEAAARATVTEGLTIERRLGDQQGIANSLEKVARLAAKPHPTHAAQLYGAAAALNAACRITLSETHQARIEAQIEAVRTALGDTAFSRAWATGQTLDWEQASDYGLSVLG